MANHSQKSRSNTVLEAVDLSVAYRIRRPYSLLVRSPGQSAPAQIRALRNVSLVCRSGVVTGVIGANGAGKSTLCLALAGILRPDSGTVRAHGKVSCLLSLGAGFAKDLTGRQNIHVNGSLLGLTRSDLKDRVADIIAFSGMRARLSFSIATTIEPEILLLDEAMGGGDQEFRSRAKQRMRQLIKRAGTIVLVSHSMEIIRSLCSQVLWLDKGMVQMIGPTDEVVKAYLEGFSDGA
jgi:ABC-type polysaccharide/polyol phosphate transport system ATPase subunit